MRRDGVIEWYLKVRRTVDTEKWDGGGGRVKRRQEKKMLV